jgi:hypothetical protein
MQKAGYAPVAAFTLPENGSALGSVNAYYK